MKRALAILSSTFDIKFIFSLICVNLFFHAMLYMKLTFPWFGSVPLVYKQKTNHCYFTI